MIKRLLLSGALAIALGGVAHAQANNSNTWQTPGNQTVGGAVTMCPNGAGLAVPCSSGAAGAAGFPGGAAPVAAVFSGADTTTQAVSLAAAAGKFTYVCGFSISGNGSTAGATVIATLAALQTLSYSYVYTSAATTPDAPVTFTYSPCLPGSAVNTAITLTVPGSAGNTATQLNIWGYQL